MLPPRSRLRRKSPWIVLVFVLTTCDSGDGGLLAPPGFLASKAGSQLPSASAGGPYTAAQGEAVAFDGSGSNDPAGPTPKLTYAWSFGDGNTGTGQKPAHAYRNIGSYTVVLTVSSGKGVTSAPDTTSVTVANVAPAVSLVLSTASASPGASVSASGSFTDPGVDDAPWHWELDWGDGTKQTGSAATDSTTISSSRTYSTAGSYTVRLSVTDRHGATGSAWQILSIGEAPSPPPPDAPQARAGGPYTGQEGAALSFDGSSSSGSGSLSYAWSFGDGGTATGPKPAYTYRDNGTYVVVLTVTDASGTASRPDTTTAVVANVAPTVSLTLSADAVMTGESVNASGSFVDPGLQDAPWQWELDWGDGTKQTGTAASVSAGISASRAYAAAGSYTVRLSVTDKDGAKGTAAVPVNVNAPGGGDPNVRYTDFGGYVTGQRPHDWSAPYTASAYRVEARSGAAGGKVLYGTIAVHGYYVLSWDVVGSVADAELETLVRVVPGSTHNESMALIARGQAGTPSFYSSRLDSGTGLWTLARYSNGSSQSLATWPNPFPTGTWVRHRFRLEGGTLRVKLWAAGNAEPAGWTLQATDASPLGAGLAGVWMRRGGAINEFDWLRVTTLATSGGGGNQPPNADFGFATDRLEVTFSDASTDPDGVVTSWSWQFGDGTIASNQHPIHTYPAAGTYTARLTVTDDAGVTSSRQRTVTVSGVGTSKVMLVGAGDIAGCGADAYGNVFQNAATAALLDRFPDAVVYTTGDNVYEDATAAQFAECYHPSWGRHKARTRPAAGNHEYYSPNATPYFEYFGEAAGDPTRGYYSYTLGSWLVIVLNSNIAVGAGSAQEQWLRTTLAQNPRLCTLAYIHHPRFGSVRGDNFHVNVTALWQALYDYGVELVLASHDHVYERFAPRRPDGALDLTRGIRQITIGTGGARLYDFGTISAHSEVRHNQSHGVLKVTLDQGAYTWEFIPVAGKSFTDSGRNACH